ncbi:hypothetical protein MHO82_23255 [Vibrio sp. Of7-15]|nr:hypothetical protein [Vibrio sp. Of7-15]
MFASQQNVNDEQLLKSLIERGVICSGLNYEEQQQALKIYLQKKVKPETNKKLGNTKHTTTNKEIETCISPK